MVSLITQRLRSAGLVFFLCIIPAAAASRSFSHPKISTSKVSLELYYESLCPYSANFVVNYLADVVNDDELISAVDLRLYPWGNAKVRSNNTFSCQHGPYECILNTVEACAIEAWPDLNDHFLFIQCIETLVLAHKYQQWGTCFQQLGLDPNMIAECFTSGRGQELELQYAAATDALVPPHEYVPWVVVDGQPLYEDYENFVTYICDAFNGTAAPHACAEPSRSLQNRRSKPGRRVTFNHVAEEISRVAAKAEGTSVV